MIDEACRQSKVGKLLPNALYVHRTALDSLDPLLRVFEGCARAYVGDIEDTNIIKLHRFSGKVSYLSYPDFDKAPHPELMRSVKVNLRNLDLDCWDYVHSDNPPVLHRKEAFLTVDYPHYDRFARLTMQEEQHGLLDGTASIGTRLGWAKRLSEKGLCLRGHRLVKAKTKA
jgi:DNA phosphorothioation-associated putative methyltransferase